MKNGVNLYEYQEAALKKMHNGCILNGGVGSGKSRTGLAYYYIKNGGKVNSEKYIKMNNPQDLYVITTARKRDTGEWESEFIPFLLCSTDDGTKLYNNKVVVDSWNNIAKYGDVTNAFFIFDEQRVVGYGAWVKAFIKIAKCNDWILLTATPGDTWTDYIPVFIANGFYKNKTEFMREHAVYRFNGKFMQIDRFVNIGRLIRLRNSLLIEMDFERPTTSHHEMLICSYNIETYRYIQKQRWDIYEDKPIENASQYCYILRRLVNSDISRQTMLETLLTDHPKVIIFYNYDYELDILKNFAYDIDTEVAEWNGHKHQELPNNDKWVYLVQYNAGAEGWNCVKTNTIIFYSENYSYKIMEQASGRIDRLNTPYKDLYYYHLTSRSTIDRSIQNALRKKKKFNEGKFDKI